MSDDNANLIPNEAVEKFRGAGNINFSLCPKYYCITSNTQHMKSLKNPDKSVIHEMKCMNYNNRHFTCEKCSWRRKAIYGHG